jgi:hypothetical protein
MVGWSGCELTRCRRSSSSSAVAVLQPAASLPLLHKLVLRHLQLRLRTAHALFRLKARLQVAELGLKVLGSQLQTRVCVLLLGERCLRRLELHPLLVQRLLQPCVYGVLLREDCAAWSRSDDRWSEVLALRPRARASCAALSFAVSLLSGLRGTAATAARQTPLSPSPSRALPSTEPPWLRVPSALERSDLALT